MIKTKDTFKKLELEKKVKAYKAKLTKLKRIYKAKAKHYNNNFLKNKKNLFQTWNGILEIININKNTSKEINCLHINNKTITDIKGITNKLNIHLNEFKVHFTTAKLRLILLRIID